MVGCWLVAFLWHMVQKEHTAPDKKIEVFSAKKIFKKEDC